MTEARPAVFSAEDVIVMADDEAFTRFMARELLGRLGAPRLIVCADGHEAAAALGGEEASATRLVLLDFNMPRRNGLQVLRDIRVGATRAPRDVAVMMVTGSEALGLVAAAVALDVDALLPKPLSAAALAEHLEGLRDPSRAIAPAETYERLDVEAVRPLRADVDPTLGRAMTLDELRDGMVLAVPVLTADGLLIVAEGTPVTPRLIRLLRGLAAAGQPTRAVRVEG